MKYSQFIELFYLCNLHLLNMGAASSAFIKTPNKSRLHFPCNYSSFTPELYRVWGLVCFSFYIIIKISRDIHISFKKS